MSKMAVFLVFVYMTTLIHAVPLAKRMIDMTYTYDNDTLHWPDEKGFQVSSYIENEGSDDPNKPWLMSDDYSSSTHAGTHMDSPAHFTKGGKTIEQLDIAHFFAPAAVVDITEKGERDPDSTVSVEDLTHWESVTGQCLDGTILLLRTGWGKKWGDRTAYFGTPENDPSKLHFPGISEEGAQWLVDNRKVLGVGIDTLSFDRGSAMDLPAHRILLGSGMFGLENVARMDEIPIYGAQLYVMPMKIGGASGAPVRIIATFPEDISVPNN